MRVQSVPLLFVIVFLLASFPVGVDAASSESLTITGTLVQLTADFTSSTTYQCFNQQVQFTDQSSGTITAYLWEYQKTGTAGWYQFSIGKDPTFKFPSTGTYDIRLTVSGPGGFSTETKTGYVTIIPASYPFAAFTASPRSGLRPLPVFFNDQSTGGDIISRKWEMRRGTYGSWIPFVLQPDTSFTFGSPGFYSVRLIVKNACDKSSTSQKDYFIRVTCPPLKAGLSASPNPVEKNHVITFTDSSTGTFTSWKLTFGDGTSTTTRNPSNQYTHTYTTRAIRYTARLTVGNGCSKSFRTIRISVTS